MILADLRRQLDIFPDRQILHQIVELEHEADVITAVGRQLSGIVVTDPLAIHDDRAAARGIHTAQNIQNRAFPRSAGTGDHDELSLIDGKAHACQCLDGDFSHLIHLFYILKLNVCTHLSHSIQHSFRYQTQCSLTPICIIIRIRQGFNHHI